MQNLFALFLALLSFPSLAFAGAWLQEEGRGQIINSYFFLNSNSAFNAQGQKTSAAEFTKNEIAPYVEYGLTEKLTLGGSASVQSIKTGAPESGDFKLSYFDIFVRSYLYKGDYVVSLEPALRVPVESATQVNPEGSKPIPELKISFGKSFNIYGLQNYANASAGYRARQEFADMAKFELTLGTKVKENITIMSQLFFDKSLTNNYTASGNYDLLKAQLSGVYDITKKYAVQGGAFANLAGKNTSADAGLIFAVWYKF